MEYFNFGKYYIRKQKPIARMYYEDLKYGCEILYKYKNRDSFGYHLIRNNVKNPFPSLTDKLYFTRQGYDKLALDKDDIEDEFYSMKEFLKNCRPILTYAKYCGNPDFSRCYSWALTNEYKDMLFKVQNGKIFAVAEDGQHMLVIREYKKHKEYLILPIYFVNMKDWDLSLDESDANGNSNANGEEGLTFEKSQVRKYAKSACRRFRNELRGLMTLALSSKDDEEIISK